MNRYIENITVNLFDGRFAQEIHFKNGLNLISGENGTGKTNLLITLKTSGNSAPDAQGAVVQSGNMSVFAISPKRNSERKTVESAFNYLKQQNRKLANYLDEYNRGLQDNTFETYAPFGELFAAYFDYKDASGGNRIETMMGVKDEFNLVMQKIFPGYEIMAYWDEAVGNPRIQIKKNGYELTLDKLSLGEQEMLSLLFNLYISRERYEVILIDEPEVHLNWSLGMNLFRFLEWFCETFNKQIIASTHSRVIFTPDFYKYTQFLTWHGDKVICTPEVSETQKIAIAGEAISLVKTVKLNKKTFFVEDTMHKDVLEILATEYNKDIAVTECGNKTSVKALYRFAKPNPEYADAYFMVDSDNEGNSYPGEDQFIFLKKYCMECYFFNMQLLAQVFSDAEENIRHRIIEIIKEKKTLVLSHYKFLEFLVDRLNPTDVTEELLSKFDCSVILGELIRHYNTSAKEFIRQYLHTAKEAGHLESVMETSLLQAINTADSIPIEAEELTPSPASTSNLETPQTA